jgi:hypothetical protein
MSKGNVVFTALAFRRTALSIMKPPSRHDKFLLVVHGSGDDLVKAKDLLKSTGHEVSVHSQT